MKILDIVLIATVTSLLCLLFIPGKRSAPHNQQESMGYLQLSAVRSDFPGFTVAGLKPGDAISSMSPSALSTCRWEGEHYLSCANIGISLDSSRRLARLRQCNTLGDVLLEKGGQRVNVDIAALTSFAKGQSDCLLTEQLAHSVVIVCRGSRLTVEYRYPQSELFQVTLEKLVK
mgnify:CR=1 FL=1